MRPSRTSLWPVIVCLRLCLVRSFFLREFFLFPPTWSPRHNPCHQRKRDKMLEHISSHKNRVSGYYMYIICIAHTKKAFPNSLFMFEWNISFKVPLSTLLEGFSDVENYLYCLTIVLLFPDLFALSFFMYSTAIVYFHGWSCM